MEMRPELVEGLAEEFPKLRRLGNERSYEDETAAYRSNTRQMQSQVWGRRELGAFTKVRCIPVISALHKPFFFSNGHCTGVILAVNMTMCNACRIERVSC